MKNLIEYTKEFGSTYSTNKETGLPMYYHKFIHVVAKYNDGSSKVWTLKRIAYWQDRYYYSDSISCASRTARDYEHTQWKVYNTTEKFESAVRRIERLCKEADSVMIHETN